MESGIEDELDELVETMQVLAAKELNKNRITNYELRITKKEMETKTLNEREIILQNNLEYTIFSWQKQSGLNPLNICDAKGVYIHDRSGKRWLFAIPENFGVTTA